MDPLDLNPKSRGHLASISLCCGGRRWYPLQKKFRSTCTHPDSDHPCAFRDEGARLPKRVCAFGAKNDASTLFSRPIEFLSRGKKWGLTQWAGSSGILWCTFSLVKETLHRHRTGFKPQRVWPRGKRVKAPKILGETAQD